jgi:hypothetical protein
MVIERRGRATFQGAKVALSLARSAATQCCAGRVPMVTAPSKGQQAARGTLQRKGVSQNRKASRPLSGRLFLWNEFFVIITSMMIMLTTTMIAKRRDNDRATAASPGMTTCLLRLFGTIIEGWMLGVLLRWCERWSHRQYSESHRQLID